MDSSFAYGAAFGAAVGGGLFILWKNRNDQRLQCAASAATGAFLLTGSRLVRNYGATRVEPVIHRPLRALFLDCAKRTSAFMVNAITGAQKTVITTGPPVPTYHAFPHVYVAHATLRFLDTTLRLIGSSALGVYNAALKPFSFGIGARNFYVLMPIRIALTVSATAVVCVLSARFLTWSVRVARGDIPLTFALPNYLTTPRATPSVTDDEVGSVATTDVEFELRTALAQLQTDIAALKLQLLSVGDARAHRVGFSDDSCFDDASPVNEFDCSADESVLDEHRLPTSVIVPRRGSHQPSASVVALEHELGDFVSLPDPNNLPPVEVEEPTTN